MTDTTQQLEHAKQEIQQFTNTVPTVNSQEASASAQNLVTVFRKEKKRQETWFKETFLNDAEKTYKQAKSAFDKQKHILKELLFPFTHWEQATTNNILAFEAKEREKRRKLEEAEAKKFQKRMEKAIEKGKDLDEVKPAMVVQAPPKTTKSQDGGFTVKVEKELVIVDESKIPEDYWIRTLNKKMVEQALRGGVDVPGAVLKEVLGSAVRTA